MADVTFLGRTKSTCEVATIINIVDFEGEVVGFLKEKQKRFCGISAYRCALPFNADM